MKQVCIDGIQFVERWRFTSRRVFYQGKNTICHHIKFVLLWNTFTDLHRSDHLRGNENYIEFIEFYGKKRRLKSGLGVGGEVE